MYLFSRGAWAIAAFVQLLLIATGKRHVNIYVPDYFCNSALKPIRRQHVHLIFYPIGEDLRPNWEAIEEMTRDWGAADLFILVHYFGFPCGAQIAFEYCKRFGSFLLEDCAHVLVPTSEMGRRGHAVIYSPHKVLGVPDGGLLVVERDLLNDLPRSGSLKVPRDLGRMYPLEEGPPFSWQILWLIKKVAQRICMTYKINWKRGAGPHHSSEGDGIIGDNRPMSSIAHKLLYIYQQDLGQFEQRRGENFAVLNEMCLKLPPFLQPLFPGLKPGSVPYVYPLLVERELVNALYVSLNRGGVPARPWPDLPPEVKNRPEAHKAAIFLRQSLVTIPIHQSLDHHHMDFMGSQILSAVEKLSQGRTV